MEVLAIFSKLILPTRELASHVRFAQIRLRIFV